MKRVIRILCALVMMITIGGCAGDEPVVVPNREAFDKAVESYLRIKSMDLAVDEYQSFELAEDGDSATAVISLEHGGEAYSNVRVRYRFDFQKTNDRWQVVSHHKANNSR